MADRKYAFPEGISSIDQKNLYEIFCNYEIVEIPGSVAEVRTQLYDKDSSKIVLKRLILNEGTFSLDVIIGSRFEYNIPSTLINVRCKGVVQKVLCLKNGFREAHFSNFDEVEYLQTYTSADLRYASMKHLKHYVYLGERMRNWGVATPFEQVPSGCVFHVENETMAKSVLKKCDVFNHYVVVDAAEWRDFPADKMALTMEEYDPESRILPEQIEKREEKKKELMEKERKEQEEKRKVRKTNLIKEMSEQIIVPKLEALLGPRIINRFTYKGDFILSVKEEKKTGEIQILVSAIIKEVIKNTIHNNKALCVEVVMNGDDLATETDLLCKFITEAKSLVEKNFDNIIDYKICFHPSLYLLDCQKPGVTLPYFDKNITAQLNTETMVEDLQTIKSIVDSMIELVEKGRKAFPKGFIIIEKEW